MYSDISLNLVLAIVVLAVWPKIINNEEHFLKMLLEIVIQPKMSNEKSFYLILL